MPTTKKHTPKPPGFKSTNRKTARMIKRYLRTREEEAVAWAKRQLAAKDNRIWFSQLLKSCSAKNAQERQAIMQQNQVLGYGPNETMALEQARAIRKETCDYLRVTRITPHVEASLSDYAAAAMAKTAHSALMKLERLVEIGDQKATSQYFRLTREMVKGWNRIARSAPLEKMASIAQAVDNWPVLMGCKPRFNDGHDNARRLKVGDKVHFSQERIDLLKPRPSKRVQAMAMEYGLRLEYWRVRDPDELFWLEPTRPATKAEGQARGLGAFSKASWRQWFNLAWQLILEESRGFPEKDPKFAPIGEHRRTHYKAERQSEKCMQKSVESNIRDGIRERLRLAFRDMAR